MKFRGVRSAQQAEIARFGPTSIGSPKHSVRSAGGCTTPTHAAPRVPFRQRRFTNPMSDPTPVPGLALHPHRHRPPTYRARLLLSGLPSGQTEARGLPLLLPEQSASVHTPPTVVSARVRLTVQLSAGLATSPNSDAPLGTPHSVPVASVHTPRPASISSLIAFITP